MLLLTTSWSLCSPSLEAGGDRGQGSEMQTTGWVWGLGKQELIS